MVSLEPKLIRSLKSNIINAKILVLSATAYRKQSRLYPVEPEFNFYQPYNISKV